MQVSIHPNMNLGRRETVEKQTLIFDSNHYYTTYRVLLSKVRDGRWTGQSRRDEDKTQIVMNIYQPLSLWVIGLVVGYFDGHHFTSGGWSPAAFSIAATFILWYSYFARSACQMSGRLRVATTRKSNSNSFFFSTRSPSAGTQVGAQQDRRSRAYYTARYRSIS